MAWRRDKGRYGTVGNMDRGSSPAGDFFCFFCFLFFAFLKSVQTSRERAAPAARAKPELRAHSASCKRAAQAARAKPELRARSASRKGKARAHLLPQPGRTRLPRPLGYTRLPRPVRVRSWGGWVRNGIKVYNLYYRLP